MKIKQAIKKSKKLKRPIYSEKCSMFCQRPGDLLYWLLETKSSNEQKAITLTRILDADDWKLEKETLTK